MSSSGSRPARYLALIYLKPGQRDRLRHYENRALPVFRRHGGVFAALLIRIEDVPLGRYFEIGS